MSCHCPLNSSKADLEPIWSVATVTATRRVVGFVHLEPFGLDAQSVDTRDMGTALSAARDV